jgi:hypothetical protein
LLHNGERKPANGSRIAAALVATSCHLASSPATTVDAARSAKIALLLV